MCESNTARNQIVEDFPLKVDELLIKCRIRSDINRAMLVGEMSKNGQFFIDRNVVPVEVYQKALLTNGMDPMRILGEIARLSGWGEPVYRAVDYRVSEGFLCSVTVRGRVEVAAWRGWRPNLAQIMAAATFLNFLGFVVNVDFYQHVLPGWSHIGDLEKYLEDVFEKRDDSPRAKPISERVLMKPKRQTIEIEDKLKRSSERSFTRMERLFQWLTKSSDGTLPPSIIDVDNEMRISCLNPRDVHAAMDISTLSTCTSETNVSKQSIKARVEPRHGKNLAKDSRLTPSQTVKDENDTLKGEDISSIDSLVKRSKLSSDSPAPRFYKEVKFGRLNLHRCNKVDDRDTVVNQFRDDSENKQSPREDRHVMRKRANRTTNVVKDSTESDSDDQSNHRPRQNARLTSSTHTITNCCLNEVGDTSMRTLKPPIVKNVKMYIKAYKKKAKDYLDDICKTVYTLDSLQ